MVPNWSLLSLGVRMLVSLSMIALVSATILGVAVVVAGGIAVGSVVFVLYFVALFVFPSVGEALLTSVLQLSSLTLMGIISVVGLVLLPSLYLTPVRREINEFKTDLGTTGTLATDRHPKIAAMARRLAQQASVPEPDVRIVNRDRPETYTLGGSANSTIIITRGVVQQLDDPEIEAVLAHEVSHLSNGDGRLVNYLLVPLLIAEELKPGARPRFQLVHTYAFVLYLGQLCLWAGLRVITTVQLWSCYLAIGICSRGRELAADTAAAELTGQPHTLASALTKLADSRGQPTEDLRTHARSAGVLDILPPAQELRSPFSTHPSTERRIERLRSMQPDSK